MTLTPAEASESLDAAGFRCPPSDVEIEAREERWLVRLPGHCMAWFAGSSSGLERLRAERRVLRLLEARCSFGAPRVLFESRDDGIFDYDAAAWADRHHDFRYLVFALDRYELLEAATSVYEPVVGRSIRRDRVLLYNAACAISYLAYRAGTGPEKRSCGRTLAEDLQWSKHAIAKALATPV